MPELHLIPAPAELEFGDDFAAFRFDAATSITLAVESSHETLFAARQLQTAILQATGLRLGIRKSDVPTGVSLAVDARGNYGSEAYELRVTADSVAVIGGTEAGLFYGVQTLKQLLRTQGARIPALIIRDRPVLANRGLMLDVSRCKVPTLATLFALVDGLAAYKYNQLQLYVEHTFDFASHPDIGAGVDPLTADDMLALDEYCRRRHIELVPNLQSFGHQRHMLSMPRYAHLDEVGWRWSLTPAREETYQLLAELYADFLPAFSSEWLNVDCDETWDLGTGQSKGLVDELGKGRLYLRHILRLRELAATHGRRIMVWADVLHHYPELVPELPDDVLLLDWEYEARDKYPTTETLAKSGRPFWVCPGTSSWNTLFPRMDNSLGNIRNYVRDGLSSGATGMLLTDWGDYGHYQPLSLSWYAYLFGAATAWSGAQTTPEEFDAAFAPQFLGRPSGDPAVAAMRRLGKAVVAPTLGFHNRSTLALALFEDPLKGPHSLEADPSVVAEVLSAATDAVAAWATLPHAGLRYDLSFMARLVALAATKVHLTQRLRADLRESRGALAQDIAELRRLRGQVPAIRSEFETRWLEHARRSEIAFILEHFDVLERDCAAALAWLEGGSVDAEASSYSPEPFARLWEQGFGELRKLADVAGVEALPEGIRDWLQRTQAAAPHNA